MHPTYNLKRFEYTYEMNKPYHRLRQQQETARAGIQWTFIEDQKLMEAVEQKKLFEEIALQHQRTVKSIQFRTITLGMKKYKELTIEAMAEKLNLKPEDIQSYIEHQEEKQRLQEDMMKDRGVSLKDLYNVMLEIRDLLTGLTASKGL